MKINCKNPENIYEIFLPIYYLFKFFGLFPFSFKGPVKCGKLRFNFLDGLWCICIVSMHLLVLYLNLGELETTHVSWKSKILHTLYKFLLIAGLGASAALSINQWTIKGKIKDFFETLERFDEQTRNAKLPQDFKRHRVFAALWTYFGIFLFNGLATYLQVIGRCMN